MKGYNQIKENRSLSPWGWMVPILKMRRFSCLLPPEMGEIAQTFMSEIHVEWLAGLKCRATGLSTSLFLRNEGARNARNVLYYPYWQYTDLFIFRFVSLLCLRSTLRLLPWTITCILRVLGEIDIRYRWCLFVCYGLRSFHALQLQTNYWQCFTWASRVLFPSSSEWHSRQYRSAPV